MGTIENFPQDRALAGSADDRHAAGRARAARISKEIRRAARQLRNTPRPVGFPAEGLKTLGVAIPTPEIGLLIRGSFLALVLLPTLLALAYFGLIASSQYEAESRFAVRTGALSGIDAFTSMAGIPSVNQVQDSLIVANFVTSRAAVEALDERIGLRERFSGGGVDMFSRLGESAPIEDLVSYWEEMVSVAIESTSGIITVSVRAFTPEDAQEIAEALIIESEELVNRLGARARQDQIVSGERELARAEQRVRAVAQDLSALRQAEGMIDPQLTVDGINTLINELRAEAVRIEQEIATTRRTIAEEAPQITLLQVRLDAVREQMAELRRQLASESPGDKESVAQVMTRFDQLALERQIAERQYAMAAASLEQARASAERQQMYLATFVRPVLPQDPAAPHPLLYTLVVLLVTGALWTAALAAGARIRERWA